MLTFQEDWISQMGSDSYPQILGTGCSSYKAISITWLSDFLIDWQTDKTDELMSLEWTWYAQHDMNLHLVSCELWTIIFKMLTLSSRAQEAMANLVTLPNINGKKSYSTSFSQARSLQDKFGFATLCKK